MPDPDDATNSEHPPDFGWEQGDDGEWSTRDIPCAPGDRETRDYLVGRAFVTDDGWAWAVDYHESVIDAPHEAIRHGQAATIDQAKEAATQQIHDMLAEAQTELASIGEGTVVRHRRHSRSGTVVQRAGNQLHVAWHHSSVEDEVSVDEVEIVTDPSPEQRAWRGGRLAVNHGIAKVIPFPTAQPALDLEWTETEPGQWTTRRVPNRPFDSITPASDYLLGHVLALEGGARWLVDYHTTISRPPYQTVSEGSGDTIDAAKAAVAREIRDLLAL